MNTPDRKMYKILCPMERNGRKWWMSLGMGFTNRDASINLHLDAVPVGQTNLVLQLREYTEEDMRLSAERRATFNTNRGGYTNNHAATRHGASGASNDARDPRHDARNDVGSASTPLGNIEIEFHPGAEPLVPQSVPF